MESIKSTFYQIKNSKWYLLTLAAIAFFIGYFLFNYILEIELKISTPTNLSSVYFRVFQYAFIEQVLLGSVAMIFFLISGKYYLPIFTYIGFSVKYFYFISDIRLIAQQYTPILSLLPVIFYILSGAILVFGLRYGKKAGSLAILINILFLATYNYVILAIDQYL